MNRGGKMVLVSHCLLNINAKIDGIAYYPAGATELIHGLMEKGYGIIQLPCLEMEMCGPRRWGQVEEQLNNPFFKKYCTTRLESYILQIKAYMEQGYTIAGVIGINGSPTCGINETCSRQGEEK